MYTQTMSPEILEAAETVVMVTAIVTVLIIYALAGLITGLVSRKLARKKGYRGYFWTGFLLNCLGVNYVAGLPEKKKKRRQYDDEED